MKAWQTHLNRVIAAAHQHCLNCRCLAVVLSILGVAEGGFVGRGQQPEVSVQEGAQVLTRGPVHEAFAGIVLFNPQPGVVVTKAPPAAIEESPPDQRPEGDNVAWIPGYWAWDDERADFLWVSGTWRALPPGRAWMAGYWGKQPQGYQWTCGYWADAAVRETTYLPPPPSTVEVGPNVAAPSPDYGWTPGCWLWVQGRYVWGPGYWALGSADWDWVPPHYVWTPRGHIFVGGFWDYSIPRRGVLFAPVYFESGLYLRRGYNYSPTIVVNLGVFTDHLFLRPYYHHYYFGDYYAPSYVHGGFYASFSFQSDRHGYDPIYSHQRWENRRDGGWEHRVQESYQYRRDHDIARPPHTWAAQQRLTPATVESPNSRMLMATPMNQLSGRKESPVRLQPLAKQERQKLLQRGQEVQKSVDTRRTLEAKSVATTDRQPARISKPTQVVLPKSPIVAKPVKQLGPNPAPPPAQRAPEPALRQRPTPGTPARASAIERSQPQTETQKAKPEPSPARAKAGTVSQQKQTTPETTRSTRELRNQPQAEPSKSARQAPQQGQPALKQPGKKGPDGDEKGATKLMKMESQKGNTKKPAASEEPRSR